MSEDDTPKDEELPDVPDGYEALEPDPELMEDAVDPTGGITAPEDDVNPQTVFGEQPADDTDDPFASFPQDVQSVPPLPAASPFEDVFPVTLGTDGTWTELANVNGTLSTFTDGRTNTATTGPFVPLELATDQALLLRLTNGSSQSDSYLLLGGGSFALADAFFVSCIQNGSDGAGPTYDCYDIETLATKLNLLGPLPPTCSRVRLNGAITPIAAATGSIGIAGYTSPGVLSLFDLPETVCAVTFVFGVS